MRFRRIEHGVVDSTSERAFEAIAGGQARHGDVHVARAQTAGRGRRGRSWWSPPDEGLYLSLVLLPPPPSWSPASLTIASGLAVFDAVGALGLRGARLDWPNDLVVHEAKLAGVLVETRGLDPEHPHYVVGLGLNVRQREFPAEMLEERRLASLRTLGLDLPIDAVLETALEALGRRVDQVSRDLAGLGTDYLRATRLEGRAVRVREGEEIHVGRLEDLSVSEGILLRAADGSERRFALETVREVAASL